MREALRICLLVAVSLCSFFANAQQFDWVRGGGTTQTSANLQVNPEAAYYTCTDPHGNVYALNIVGNSPITADTFYRSSAYGNDLNLLLTSYTCNGQMRWAKLIASNVNLSRPYGITADSLGHIYIVGQLPNTVLHIGYDATISGMQNQLMGLIQFDTAGHYNWIKYIGDNTNATYIHQTGYGPELLPDANNNIHFFLTVKSGMPVMPGVYSQWGEYDFKYSPSGSLLSATRLDMDSSWYINDAALDPVTNKLYVCGIRNNYLVGGSTVPASFAAAFDANRTKIWMDTMDNNYSGLKSIIYDRIGHLYFNGYGDGVAFSFRGHSTPISEISAVMKTDTAGNPIWIQYNTISSFGSNGYATGTITLLSNNLVVSAGGFGNTITDGIHTISVTGQGVNPFLSILDTSGVPMSLIQIFGNGVNDGARSITSDQIGNVYIGGQVEDSIFVPGITAYHSVGGNTDFFVMKYGLDCNCTSMPVANYNVAGADTAHTRNFTYTGTTAGIDSIRWYFGNGVGDTVGGMTASHTFDTGYFEVCVEVFSGCGNDLHCMQIHIVPPTGVNNVSLQKLDALVYPNPAKGELKIVTKDLQGTYRLMNLTGVTVQSGNIKSANTNVSMQGLSSGMYLLEIKSVTGQSETVKIVKE